MSHISDKSIIARKRHICRVCGTGIDAGERCHAYRGVESGEGFYSLHFHAECWDYSRDWDACDWESHSPGNVSRDEVIRDSSDI